MKILRIKHSEQGEVYENCGVKKDADCTPMFITSL